jgi:egghead protein (zeste-white 4 protein)
MTPITYYISVFLPVILNVAFFIIAFGGVGYHSPGDFDGWLLFCVKFFWFSGVLVALSNFVGLTIFTDPDRANKRAVAKFLKTKWDRSKALIVVYVSRGDNVQALLRSVTATEALLEEYGVRSRVDVVTDVPVEESLQHIPRTKFHLVPEGYATLKGAKWKARALHYVVEQHEVEKVPRKDVWVLHLDEESQMHLTSLAGIAEFIADPRNANRIGQGEIKYNAYNYGKHLLITWLDSLRSGDDIGRFRFQFRLLGRPLFGMHGSFILAPMHIERRFGFDLGGKGSVTEDAYFALKCASEGVRFGWVNGYIREQSPFTIGAILKQRRRWYCGLMALSFDRSIALRTRLPLLANTLLWSIAWIGPIVTVVALVFGGYFPITLLLSAAVLQGFYASTYMVGAWRNLRDAGSSLSWSRKLVIYLGTVVVIPLTNAIEGAAVLYGIIKPVKTFDVVSKDAPQSGGQVA